MSTRDFTARDHLDAVALIAACHHDDQEGVDLILDVADLPAVALVLAGTLAKRWERDHERYGASDVPTRLRRVTEQVTTKELRR